MVTVDSTETKKSIAKTEFLLRRIGAFQEKGNFDNLDTVMCRVGGYAAELHALRKELLTFIPYIEDADLKRNAIRTISRIIRSIRDLERGLILVGKSGKLDGILPKMGPGVTLASQTKKKGPILFHPIQKVHL